MSYCFGDPNMIRKARPNDWTEQEVESLRKLAKSGISQREAAAELGRDRIAIKNKCKRLGIRWGEPRVRGWMSDEISLLHKVASTHTVRQAAEMLGRSHGSVKWKTVELGIKFRKYGEAHPECRLPTAKLPELFELKKQGLTNQEIADRLGISAPNVGLIANFQTRYRESLPMLEEGGSRPRRSK